MRTLRIGNGSAYWGDMLDPAVELAEKGELDYLGRRIEHGKRMQSQALLARRPSGKTSGQPTKPAVARPATCVPRRMSFWCV